jgi:tRNA (mo5U34)-methyltransferase
MEERYANDPTNWFIPNKAAVEAMLRSAGFVIHANPEWEVYLVERGKRHLSAEPPPRIVSSPLSFPEAPLEGQDSA